MKWVLFRPGTGFAAETIFASFGGCEVIHINFPYLWYISRQYPKFIFKRRNQMRAVSALAIALFFITAAAAQAACPEGYYNCGSNLCCPK
jgi:hypothetical protein